MDNKTFWNEVAKYGLLLGIVMSGSKIFEQSMVLNGMQYFGWVALEGILMVVFFFVLLYKVTKKRALRMDPALGFSFGQGVSYMMLIAAFAAVPVACVYYVYLNSIVGYDTYVDRLVELIASISNTQPLDQATADAFDLVVDQVRNQAQPSILSTLFSTIFQYLFAGLFAGLILAGFTSRKPEIFE